MLGFEDIYFVEEGHRYVYRADPSMPFTSVTSTVEEVSPSFQTEYWLVYKSLQALGYQVRSHNKGGVPEEFIDCSGTCQHYSAFDVDTSSLRYSWDKAAEQGKAKGTFLHDYLEALAARKFPVSDERYTYQERQAKAYWFDHWPEVQAKELVVGCPRLGIAGQLDRYDKNKNLIDYKTDKEIEFKNPWENLHAPFHNMPACNFSKYTIQLNLYRYLLESRGYQVSDMSIIHFPPEGADAAYLYMEYPVPSIQDIIHRWLEGRLNKDHDDSRITGYVALVDQGSY